MKKKIELLEKAMWVRNRDDDASFACFSDEAPEEFIDLFLKHYEVRDLDYAIFSDAIDAITESWNAVDGDLELLQEWIDDNQNEFASIYNADRLAYLNIWNDEEIATAFKEYDCDSVSMACACWYDNEVMGAIDIIINQYLISK